MYITLYNFSTLLYQIYVEFLIKLVSFWLWGAWIINVFVLFHLLSSCNTLHFINSRTVIPFNAYFFLQVFSSAGVISYAQSGVFAPAPYLSIFCTDFFALYSGDETREAPAVFVVFHMYPTTGTPWLTFTFSPRQDESLEHESFSVGKLVLPLFHFSSCQVKSGFLKFRFFSLLAKSKVAKLSGQLRLLCGWV